MEHLPVSLTFRPGELARRGRAPFRLAPDAEARARLAALLGIEAIPVLDFDGSLAPSGRDDVTLAARLRARVVQPCVVTLAPVTTEIDELVTRRYLADYVEPEADEIEMREDDTAEPLPATIDVAEVMAEALALALPLYPRAPDAGAAAGAETEEGATEPNRPFAGLGALIGSRREGGGNDG